jgi:hypothetical protein
MLNGVKKIGPHTVLLCFAKLKFERKTVNGNNVCFQESAQNF